MQVVILAAGRGKRMKNLTRATAKSMLKIKGKPILAHKIDALPKSIKEIIFVVGYHSMHIISYFKRYYQGRRIIYVFQTNLNGTGGALHLTKSILKNKFLVMMGDDLYCRKNISQMIKLDLAILGHQVEEVSQFGIIKTNRQGYMIDVIEKPKKSKCKLANTGMYLLNKKFFDYELVSISKGNFGLPQTLAKMAKKHKIKVVEANNWLPIEEVKDLEKAKKYLTKFL